MNANILTFSCGEMAQDFIVQLYKGLEQLGTSPWIARVIFGGKSTLGEVNGDSLCTGFKATTDIFHTLRERVSNAVDKIRPKHLLR